MLPFDAYRKSVWRLIELQSQPATLKITDSLEEQAELEAILEESKPDVPKECLQLSYQLRSPFRYGRYPNASRFRRAGRTPGVYYAAEDALTAALEAAWYRGGFFKAAIDMALPEINHSLTAIEVLVKTPRAVDLRKPPLSEEGNWTDPNDYADCLNLADRVRGEGGEVIIYKSVRHPKGGPNVAVLTCFAFERPDVVGQQTWHIHIKKDRIILHCETTRLSYEFVTDDTSFSEVA